MRSRCAICAAWRCGRRACSGDTVVWRDQRLELDAEGRIVDRNEARACYNGLRAPVAQLDRASGYEPEGRVFESLRAHHKSQTGIHVQIQGTRGHSRLSDLNKVAVRDAHVAPLLRCMDFGSVMNFAARDDVRLIVSPSASAVDRQPDLPSGRDVGPPSRSTVAPGTSR